MAASVEGRAGMHSPAPANIGHAKPASTPGPLGPCAEQDGAGSASGGGGEPGGGQAPWSPGIEAACNDLVARAFARAHGRIAAAQDQGDDFPRQATRVATFPHATSASASTSNNVAAAAAATTLPHAPTTTTTDHTNTNTAHATTARATDADVDTDTGAPALAQAEAAQPADARHQGESKAFSSAEFWKTPEFTQYDIDAFLLETAAAGSQPPPPAIPPTPPTPPPTTDDGAAVHQMANRFLLPGDAGRGHAAVPTPQELLGDRCHFFPRLAAAPREETFVTALVGRAVRAACTATAKTRSSSLTCPICWSHTTHERCLFNTLIDLGDEALAPLLRRDLLKNNIST